MRSNCIPAVGIVEMTPADYADGYAGLSLRYEFAETRFGRILIAASAKGAARLDFIKDDSAALENLRNFFPNAKMLRGGGVHIENALAAFEGASAGPVKLHLKGSAFRLAAWKALLDIPAGKTESYGSIARRLGCPKACRAVGTAIGANPVAYFVPCHRAVPATGALGKYRWGSDIKRAMLDWEKATEQLF